MPGQLVTGRHALSEDTGISEQSIRTCLSRLKSTSEITSESTNQFTLITINNWGIYQDILTSESTSESTSDQPAINQRSTTNKKYKKEKNIRKQTLSPSGDIPFGEIVDHLNQRTGKAFKPDGFKIRALIAARWREGFKTEDFARVVDNQTIKWLRDPKMCEFLRPETLFGTKFESYLNAPPNLAQAGVVSASSLSIMNWAERKMKEGADEEK